MDTWVKWTESASGTSTNTSSAGFWNTTSAPSSAGPSPLPQPPNTGVFRTQSLHCLSLGYLNLVTLNRNTKRVLVAGTPPLHSRQLRSCVSCLLGNCIWTVKEPPMSYVTLGSSQALPGLLHPPCSPSQVTAMPLTPPSNTLEYS